MLTYDPSVSCKTRITDSALSECRVGSLSLTITPNLRSLAGGQAVANDLLRGYRKLSTSNPIYHKCSADC